MEPTIYKPSIYKGAGIYKTGAGGGVTPEFDGVFTPLIVKTQGTSYLDGVLTEDAQYTTNATQAFKWSISKKTPVDITNFKTIEWKFKIYLKTGLGGDSFNHLICSNYSDEFLDMDASSALTTKVYVKTKTGSQIGAFSIGTLTKNNWHFIEIMLDKLAGKIKINLDNANKVNTNLDYSQINTTSFIPSYGCYRTTATPYLHEGISIGREMSLKVDGVETFDTL